MIKALVQFGAGEAALWVAATLSGHVIVGAVVVFATYAVIEWAWGEFNVAKKIVTGLENAIESEG
ncbi:hypothetical protein [Vibrio sinaloensis]|uniref:hypothetical protein n=1 Tax=Photobacterium sp. (strain ATCC 43367) TaxID=379097 RepID=UPI0022B045A7|nr:hypothetical protein [Vibrio sinaloensis]MCZ4293236.1 hypothetical protein [Vibrio sinaloensis]